jgi:hypothetical protein
VTLIAVEKPGEEQYYVMCLDPAISGSRLIRALKRRHWIEYCFQTLERVKKVPDGSELPHFSESLFEENQGIHQWTVLPKSGFHHLF